MTQQALALKLGVDRSTVNKRLLGDDNLTLRTIADFAWALDRDINFSLDKPIESPKRNYTTQTRTSGGNVLDTRSIATRSGPITTFGFNPTLEDA